ncbi:MAG: hypothetical protein CMJ42_03235 [Phyllobacteriaceae bacterium]|nr:hypothetical protein [Phyllobacteriaceae bacterium]MBA93013.1 hypothetical protein [Phyllobacteriaceae bacterium]
MKFPALLGEYNFDQGRVVLFHIRSRGHRLTITVIFLRQGIQIRHSIKYIHYSSELLFMTD